MNINKTYQRLFGFILVTLLLVGCGKALSPTEGPVIAPTEALVSAEAPASLPAPGAWAAATDFGKVVFTVDATGTKITKMSYQFSNWTCGPTGTTSGTIDVSSEWPVTDGQFLIEENFSNVGNQTMTFSGMYTAADQKFSGTWDEIVYGSKCSGTWEATEHHEAEPINEKPTIVITATILSPTLTSVPPTPTPAGPFVYIVVAGDTCNSIAAKFTVDLQLLLTLNNIDPSCPIYVGQQLMIPTPDS